MSKHEPTVTVRGEGQVEGPPELATVGLILHTSGRTAADVTRNLADLSRQVDHALPDLAFDSVRTDPLSVSPVFDRRSGVRITGYTGRYSARYRLAGPDGFAGLSDLVVALTTLPGAQVDGPAWSLKRDSPLHKQARLAAVQDARARAQDYAAALDMTLGDLLKLSDTDHSLAPMSRALAFRAQASEPVELDLEPQPQTVTATVTARFVLNAAPTDG